MSGEGPFLVPGSETDGQTDSLPTVPSVAEGAGALWGLFGKHRNPTHGESTLMT